MSRNQKLIVAVGALVVAAIMFVLNSGGSVEVRRQDRLYFYDLTSGEVFEHDAARPPIDAPGGAGKGVLAYVIGCGSCDESARKVLYLKTYTPEAIAAFENPTPETPEAGEANLRTVAQGTMIASPPAEGSDPHWVIEMTPEGDQILARQRTLCGSQQSQPCNP